MSGSSTRSTPISHGASYSLFGEIHGRLPWQNAGLARLVQYLFRIRTDLLLYGLKARRIAQLREAATNFFNLAKLIPASMGKDIAFEWHNHCGLS